jgi:hypothetical protein
MMIYFEILKSHFYNSNIKIDIDLKHLANENQG